MERITLITPPQSEYELLDSGEEEKLERFGTFLLARPDPQALWEKTAPEEWKRAQGRYTRTGREGQWKTEELPKEWPIHFDGMQFLIRPTSFKHTGLFPEQLSNWEWMRNILTSTPKPVSILNLFAYTGGATLAAAKAGASVCHVDASKPAVAWAKENAALSDLPDAPIRWIVDDVFSFVQKEIQRGRRYDGIVLDPPAFGHGPKNELWKIEEHFVELLRLLEELLSDDPLFVLVNGYAAGYSPLAFAYNLSRFEKKFRGDITYGDLAIAQTRSERLLPCGIFARWEK